MAATHPPVELRLEALQAALPDDWEYQEEELRGPSKTEIRRLLSFHHRRRVGESGRPCSQPVHGAYGRDRGIHFELVVDNLDHSSQLVSLLPVPQLVAMQTSNDDSGCNPDLVRESDDVRCCS